MKRIWRGNLKPWHAIVVLAVAGGTLIAAVVAYQLHREYSNYVEGARTATQNLARMLEEHVRQSLRGIDLNILRAADALKSAGDPSLTTDSAAIRERLRAQLSADGLIRAFAVIDRDGVIRVSTLGDDVRGLPVAADRDYFTMQRERADLGIVLGATIKSRVTGAWTLPVSLRLNAPGGAFDGVLVASVDPARLQSFYDSIDTGANGFVTMFHRQGWIVVRSPFSEEIVSRNWADSPMFREHLPASATGTVRQVVAADGVERIYSYRALKEYPVVVSVGLSLTDLLAEWRASAWRDAFVALVVLAMLAGAVWAITRELRRRAQVEATLRRLSSIVEATSDLIATARVDGQFVYLNAAARRVAGIGPDEDVTRYSNKRVYTPEQWAFMQQVARPAALKNGTWSGEYELKTPDGRTMSLSQVLIAHRDARGEAEFFTGISRDITERKRSETALTEAKRRLEIALEGSLISVWESDLRTNEILLDANWAKYLGKPPAETRTTAAELLASVHPEDRQSVAQVAVRVMKGESPSYAIEHRVQSASGDWKWILSRGRVIEHGAEGRPLRLSGTNTDITERKQAELKLAAIAADLEAKVASRTEELAKALEAANAADRMKSDFMANVTHELRTPLNSVIGFSELLKDEVPGPLNAKQAGFAADILAGGQRLLVLVEGILEMSRLDAATLALEAVEIGPALGERVAAHRNAAAARNIVIQLEMAPETGGAELDPKALRRMLDALVDNAIKFNRDGGSVAVSARRNGGWLEIAVTDTGIGIAHEDLPKLFKPLVQLDVGLARRHGGIGMGLALARRLAELHGGTIEVASEPGKGSTFTLRLPTAKDGVRS